MGDHSSCYSHVLPSSVIWLVDQEENSASPQMMAGFTSLKSDHMGGTCTFRDNLGYNVCTCMSTLVLSNTAPYFGDDMKYLDTNCTQVHVEGMIGTWMIELL